VRETGILALGAIAECQRHMADHMQHIFPYLLKQLVDSNPLIRRITCWTLSRYSSWIFEPASALDDSSLQGLIVGLMNRVLDRHKLVQEAACSALTSMIGEARSRLDPFLEYVLQNFMHAFKLYQAKNVLILADTIGTLADAVGSALNKPAFAGMLIPPLWSKWQAICLDERVPDQDINCQLYPLLECLTSVVQALGPGIQPYSQMLFSGALALVELDDVDPAIAVCALDLISALAIGLQGHFWTLACAVRSRPPESRDILEIVDSSAKCESLQVRQSACALLGEIAKGCGQHFAPILDNVMPVLIRNLNKARVPVCNNASWAIGELVLRVRPSHLHPYVDTIMACLIPLVNDDRTELATLAENAAITIGRVACVCPGLAAPQLGQFCRQWCLHISHLQNSVERENASRALCLLAIANPSALADNFRSFCDTAIMWGEGSVQIPSDVFKMYRSILQSYLLDIRSKQTSDTEALGQLIKKFSLQSSVSS